MLSVTRLFQATTVMAWYPRASRVSVSGLAHGPADLLSTEHHTCAALGALQANVVGEDCVFDTTRPGRCARKAVEAPALCFEDTPDA